MGNSFPIILIFVFAAIITGAIFSRARQMLESWAKENGYQILRSELRWFRRGPFFWTTSRNQMVYYVSVRNREGVTRNAWVRCGTWWLGVFQYKAEVRWEE